MSKLPVGWFSAVKKGEIGRMAYISMSEVMKSTNKNDQR